MKTKPRSMTNTHTVITTNTVNTTNQWLRIVGESLPAAAFRIE
jgi:hypothetical protein